MPTHYSDRQARHYWFGQPIAHAQLQEAIDHMHTHLDRTLASEFHVDHVLRACQSLSDQLNTQGDAFDQLVEQAAIAVGQTEAKQLVSSLADLIRRAPLEAKLRSELGSDTPGVLERKYPQQQYEAWLPVGCVVHVMPSNVLIAAAMALLESLLPGNINIVKVGARDTGFTSAFARLLVAHDRSDQLKHYIAVLHLSSQEQATLQQLFQHADLISAWGGEAAITAIKRNAPASTKVIAWGHKVSFGYIAHSCINEQHVIDAFAADVCRLDQQACSSPQTLFIETEDRAQLQQFAQRLAHALARISPTIPAARPDVAEQAEITSVLSVVRAEKALGLTDLIEDPQGQWRVLVGVRPGLSPSPLFRTIWVKPIQRAQLGQVLRPMRPWLQTCGLATDVASVAELTRQLLAAGVTRITRASQMIDSYTGAPHDGVYALQQLARRVSVDGPPDLHHVGSFAQLTSQPAVLLAPDTPVMTKSDFQQLGQQASEQPVGLIVRSGGSSGQVAYSRFTWPDYARQMQVASHGLVAAGLEPEHDRVMNLFAAGYMYGSFISFWTILEHLGVEQLPMAMISEYDLIAEQIISHKVNTLIGMTPHLMGLMASHGKQIKEAGCLRKLFYGGESLSQTQQHFLTHDCGIALVRSVAYGSNDAGPIGYQCTHSHGSVHHLFTSLQHMEIVQTDSDAPAAPGDIGRFLLTSKARSEPVIERYEIGDMGRWIEGTCSCGRTDPRFELAGRIGDVFKAGTPLLNYDTFVQHISQRFDYAGPLQIHLDSAGPDTLIMIWTDPTLTATETEVVEHLFDTYPDLAVARHQHLPVIVSVEKHVADDFVRVKASGKIRHICDHRISLPQ